MKKIAAIVVVAALAGCGNIDKVEMTRDEMLGTAAGAALGGYLGYQFGGGVIMNSLFATGGALAGGTAGFMTTRALLGSDRAAYERTAQKGLASAKDGAVVQWDNPETGISGIFRPMNSFYTADGRLCRQYRATVAFAKGMRRGIGMACKEADGNWQMVSDDLTTQG